MLCVVYTWFLEQRVSTTNKSSMESGFDQQPKCTYFILPQEFSKWNCSEKRCWIVFKKSLINIFCFVSEAAKKLKMLENQAQEEMGRFKETAPLPITKGASPLNWWREHECEFPLLSQLAKRYLCIPGTSVSWKSFLHCRGHYYCTEEYTQPRAPRPDSFSEQKPENKLSEVHFKV